MNGRTWDRPIAPVPGPIRFARYAFGPNRLGYCGPDEATELFEQATTGHDLRRLRELAAQFEGVDLRARDVPGHEIMDRMEDVHAETRRETPVISCAGRASLRRLIT